MFSRTQFAKRWLYRLLAWTAIVVCAVPAWPRQQEPRDPPAVPALELAGGRRLEFVRAISTEQQVKPNRSLWNRVLDWVAGPAPIHGLLRPYGLALDSRGRVLVTDPEAAMVHILDFEKQKLEEVQPGKGRALLSPIGVSVDGADNIYVTDSQQALIFVFDPKGKFLRTLGLQGGAKLFLRPTGIAVDRVGKLLYVADTLGHRVRVLDLQGRLVRTFGQRGMQQGSFNFPTEIAVRGDKVIVVDAMNFRVQTFSPEGHFLHAFGVLGDRAGTLLRPKGMALDSEGNIYLADGLLEIVQVFTPEGKLLYHFGRSGAALGEFQLPAGIAIDPRNRIYVADSLNRRVQVFQFRGPAAAAAGGGGL